MIQYVYTTVLYTYMYICTMYGITYSTRIEDWLIRLEVLDVSCTSKLIPWYSSDIPMIFLLLSFKLGRTESLSAGHKTKTRGDHSLVLGLALSLQCSERLPWKVKVKGGRRERAHFMCCDVAMTWKPGETLVLWLTLKELENLMKMDVHSI